MTTRAVSTRRVSRVINFPCTGRRSIGSRVEAFDRRGRSERVLVHANPQHGFFMARVAATRHACVNHGRSWCRRHEATTW